MEKFGVFVVVFSLLFHGGIARLGGRKTQETGQDGLEEWGYVEVRPKAHMFWWLYKSPHRVENPTKPWPIVLWLQGGPGVSGTGHGNFNEIGPLDVYLKPRNHTWLRNADLLFVDNPVGTGFSYVEEENLFVTTDYEAAADLVTFLEAIFNKNENLQKSPLYLFSQSYGGKYAVTLALEAIKAIEAGKLKLKLGGVALGNSFMSPLDFAFSYGPLLKDVSRIDKNDMDKSNSMAQKIKQQVEAGQFLDARTSWSDQCSFLSNQSNKVDFCNFELDSFQNPFDSLPIKELMNDAIRKKLKIIPEDLIWEANSDYVQAKLAGDMMKSRIGEVEELLAKGVNVTVYSGQLDVICATPGTEAWVEKIKWEGIQNFLNTKRTPMYCGDDKLTRGFTRSYKNLHFYWILKAGHLVPLDEPCIALNMMSAITDSPAPPFK